MNVLILNDAGFGLKGGGAVYGKEVYCEILARINVELGNRVLKVALGGERGASVDVVTLEGSKAPIVRTLYDRYITGGLRKLCEDFRVDLIHANILNAHYPLLLSKLSRKLGLLLVLTVHSWAYLCPTTWNVVLPELRPCEVSSPNRGCLRCIMSKEGLHLNHIPTVTKKMLFETYALQSLLKEATCVISPSRFFAEKLYEKLGIRAYPIPNPVSPHLLGEKPRSEGDNGIVFVGRLDFEKGVHLLPNLAEIVNPVDVHVLGGGRLEKLFPKSKAPNLLYHGFVPEDEKLDLIRGASVMVVPSVWCDMFPTTVFEAFALGKPVVAFDLGGPKEMIEDSGGGLLAKPFDIRDFAEKVEYLVENPVEAKKMGLRGMKWVEENLHPIRYAKALAKVYDYAVENCKTKNLICFP